MNASILSATAGLILSILFNYVPGLNTWYAALNSTKKSLIMLGLITVVALAVFGLSCTGLWTWVACTKAGAAQLVEMWIAALVANVGGYVALPQTKPVKLVKIKRNEQNPRL